MDLLVEFVVDTCCSCGISFAIPKHYQDKLRNTHQTFYCPNGHTLHFPSETEKEKLQRELNHTKQKLKATEKSKNSALRCCTELEMETDKLEKSIRGYRGYIGKIKKAKEVQNAIRMGSE